MITQHGVVQTKDGYFLIEPLKDNSSTNVDSPTTESRQAVKHVIYRHNQPLKSDTKSCSSVGKSICILLAM